MLSSHIYNARGKFKHPNKPSPTFFLELKRNNIIQTKIYLNKIAIMLNL